MTDLQPQETAQPPSEKFYSQLSIGLATFLGGPLAAGILIRQNFLNEGKNDTGNHALFIGVLSTILLFVGIFSIPEDIIDTVPNSMIPAIYTGIIYVIVERFQGETLKHHEEAGGEFYSGWRAAGMGLIGLVIMAAGIFGFAFAVGDDFDAEAYDAKMEVFYENEEKALKLYEYLEEGKIRVIPPFIKEFGMPAWKANIRILNEMDNMPNLYPELKPQNDMLRKYCNMRIEVYQLIEKAITEKTSKYDYEIEQLHKEIDDLLTE